MNRSQINNQRGQSLIQVMVGVAIMGVVTAAMLSLQTMQSRENGALAEKLSALELARAITATEADSFACTALFAPGNIVVPGSLTFNSTTVSATAPHVIQIRSIPGTGTSPAVVTQNTLVSPMSQSLFVPAGNLQVRVTSTTSADLVVAFQQDRLVRAIHDVSVRLNITTTGPANATTITGCTGLATTGLRSYTVSDFGALSSTVLENQPLYRATEYRVPIAAQSFERHLAMSAIGVWNVQACGGLNLCQTAVVMHIETGGVSTPCGSNTSTGSSGPYTDVVSTSVSCIAKVPPNAPATVRILYDARGGAFVNLNPATYNTGSASASTSLFTIYTLP